MFRTLFKLVREVPGLEISENAIRLIWFSGKELHKEMVNLEPGIIEGGQIKDKEKLTRSLKELKKLAGFSGKKPAIVAVLPSQRIGTQAFDLPSGQKDLGEAAILGLQTASLFPVQETYYDWQPLSEASLPGKVVLFGAFAHQNLIESFLSVLEGAGFSPIAAEFSALAMGRAIGKFCEGIDWSKPQIIAAILNQGLEIQILREGRLAFNRVLPIKDPANFKEILEKELKEALNLYSQRWGEQISQAILIAGELHQELEKFIKENTPIVSVKLPVISGFPNLSPVWLAALGGALRGSVKEKNINLKPGDPEKDFYQNQIQIFSSSWKGLFLGLSGFLAGIFLLGWAALLLAGGSIGGRLSDQEQDSASKRASAVEDQARSFNLLIEKSLVAQSRSNDWSRLLSDFNDLAKKARISLIKVILNGNQATLSASALTESAAINFKDALAGRPNYTNVNLPLADIVTGKNGISFNLTLNF